MHDQERRAGPGLQPPARDRTNLQMAFDMRYGESSHSHQLQNSLRRRLCDCRPRQVQSSWHEKRMQSGRSNRRKIEERNETRSKKMMMIRRVCRRGEFMLAHILSWPPSLWMAWTKQWCRSGVHLRRGTLDLLYCLTPPLLSLPTTVVLTIVISQSQHQASYNTKNLPAAGSYIFGWMPSHFTRTFCSATPACLSNTFATRKRRERGQGRGRTNESGRAVRSVQFCCVLLLGQSAGGECSAVQRRAMQETKGWRQMGCFRCDQSICLP